MGRIKSLFAFRGFEARRGQAFRARWRPVVGLLVVFAAGLELASHLHFARVAPGLDEWQALKPNVEELAAEGTLILVSPEWAEPNARFALGDRLMPLEHVARADSSGFERAVEISILGESASELSGWRSTQEQRAGRFVLRTWTNPRVERVLYDFVAQLKPPDASAGVLKAEGLQPCPFTTAKVTNGDLHGHPTYPRRRFNCPGGGEWSFVGVTVIEDQEYRPRRCIWAHPVKRGVLAVRFDAVPLGDKIRGYGGLPYFFERESKGAPVELSVHVAGEEVGSWRHEDGEGWKPFELSTARFKGQHLPVEFRVEAKKVTRREFCFQADVR